MARSLDIVRSADEAGGLARPPLVVLDRLEAFLDANGLGSGPMRVERIGEGGGSNFSYLVERERAARPPQAAAAAAAALGARHGARGAAPACVRAARDPPAEDPSRSARTSRAGRPLLRDGLHRRARRPRRAALGSRGACGTAAARADLVDALVEIHAADVDAARARRVRPDRGSYLERQVRRFTQLWDVNARASCRRSSQVGRAPRRAAARAVSDHGRPRRLSARQPDRRARRPGRGRRRARLGDGRDRRSPCRRRLPARHLRRARREPSPLGKSPRHGARRVSHAGELVARYAERSGRDVGRSVGSRRLRCGRPRSSARRSTAVSCAGSSPPRTAARRRSSTLSH